MSKDSLREKLFNMHFEIKDGINVSSLTKTLEHIPNTWNKLHELCEENVEFFDKYSNINNIFKIVNKGKEYLIINLGIFRFIVIDIENKKSLTDDEISKAFDKDSLNEWINDEDILRMYSIDKYNGNVDELLHFYEENKEILNLSRKIKYRLYLNDAWTYFLIDFVNGKVQLGFQTKDQYLYEQLFLEYDLTPSSMQDAVNKIGIEKITEMFSKIGEVKIPLSEIPNDLLEEYKKRQKEYVKSYSKF